MPTNLLYQEDFMNYQPYGRRFSMNQFRAPDIDYAPAYSWVRNTRLTPESVCAAG